MAKGRYEFPFVFPLPPGIPGRLYASSPSGDDTFSISYHLEARLHRKGVIATDITNKQVVKNSQRFIATDTSNKHEVKNSQGFIVIDRNNKYEVKNSVEIMVCDPPRPIIPCPSFEDPVTTAMRFYCCLNTGTMTLMGSLDSASVDAGEEAKVTSLPTYQPLCCI